MQTVNLTSKLLLALVNRNSRLTVNKVLSKQKSAKAYSTWSDYIQNINKYLNSYINKYFQFKYKQNLLKTMNQSIKTNTQLYFL